MRTQDFNFLLPPHLIAQYPLVERRDSRMLVYDRQSQRIHHEKFKQLIDFLKPRDLLVFNNSKVIQARMFAKKASGGRVEILVERQASPYLFLAHIRASKAPKMGSTLYLEDGTSIVVENKIEGLYQCSVTTALPTILATHGHIPLPPYIQRADEITDLSRYQTVYAKPEGSIAAPTAGLHFDDAMLQSLTQADIQIGFVTLHVGSGTFQPVRTKFIQEHQIHHEWMIVDDSLCEQIASTKAAGGRVIAVGTTAMRALETASASGKIQAFSGDTSIFIYPGYTFKLVDGLITNFHLPESTLLMLVSAWIGYEETMRLYQEAIEQEYRFFSYGDVSLLL